MTKDNKQTHNPKADNASADEGADKAKNAGASKAPPKDSKESASSQQPTSKPKDSLQNPQGNNMSRKKTNPPQNAKNTAKQTEPTTAEKKTVDKAAEQATNNAPNQAVNQAVNQAAKPDSAKTGNAVEKSGAEKNAAEKKAETVKADSDKKNTTASGAQPTAAPLATNEPTEKKSGGLVPKVALLAGLAGTVIGVYDYDQIRQLKSTDNSVALKEQISALQNQVAELSGRNTDALEKQVAALGKATDAEKAALKAYEEKVNKRLSTVEQMQNGLSKTLQGDVNETLDKRLNEVNDLLKKVDQIELAQQGITQNLSQVTAAGEAVTAKGMAKQEVGYLLRMADYKIQSEGDAAGAAGLLKIAEDKLLLLNEGKVDALTNAVRQKYQQLQGVKPVDSNSIISSLKQLTQIVPDLLAKPVEAATTETTDDSATAADSGNLLSSIGNVIASGVKYTPNDPSKIDISAETVLIEKRLMQADIRTAELAVRSQNGVLLAETINNIRTNLDKYFADNETAQSIKKTLANIEQQKLETILPDLGGLVDMFDKQ